MSAQAASRATVLARVRVIAPTALGNTALAALRARGIAAVSSPNTTIADAVDGEQLAWALETVPSASAAAELAPICARAAEAGRPVCVLAPLPRGNGRSAIEHAGALAYLRAHGAAIGHDVDAWLEAIVLLARVGMPAGPRVAVIAPPGSWLHAQALALVGEAEATGARAPQLGGDKPTDVVLYDAAIEDDASASGTNVLRVPVLSRAELADGDDRSLFGIRAAIGACDLLGRAAERIAAGLGAAPLSAGAELRTDERLTERLGKLVAGSRVGDHETKALLAGYGVAITRQAVAMTPSSAVTKARRAGYPVELKPWGHDVPSEPEGCPVIKNVTSDALVRRAFTQVLAAVGRATNQPEAAVIVRETPPLGRDVAVQFVRLPSLGWTVIVETPGGASTTHIAAAPAPLRAADATALAASLVASRAADAEPDRAGLANILRRASHLVVDLDARLERLELPRVVVGGRGSKTVVADAFALLGT